jgi:class 3 adenylate cyclase/tetratricopeptide (TPR) repeat protein
MLNVIPRFIHDKFEEGVFRGGFEAATMFVDVAGFTPMTEALMRRGKEGAEVLSGMLNRVLRPVITTVYRHDGYVSSYAGDAFTAVFPGNAPAPALSASLSVQELFKRQGVQKTGFGDFNVSARAGVSLGTVHWGIVGTATRKTYYFKGKPIEGCAYVVSLCNPGEVIMDETASAALPDAAGRLIIKAAMGRGEYASGRIRRKVVSRFAPQAVLSAKTTGEFREVAPAFISFEDDGDAGELDRFTGYVLEQAGRFGGYFNCMEFGDKGPVILVLFGAPISYENNAARALDFALAVKAGSGRDVRAGITYGPVYAGIIGSRRRCTYGVLGDTVNTAARLTAAAEWNEVRVSEEIAERAGSGYRLEDLGLLRLKGKAGPTHVLELRSKRESPQAEFFEGEMVGREAELELAREYCRPVLKGEFGGVLYVYGDAGIGKSRLLHELAASMAGDAETFFLRTDDILRKSMNPFASLFSEYFGQSEAQTETENRAAFEAKWEEFIGRAAAADAERGAPVVAELQRTKSVLAALAGLRWPDSLYEKLDPKGRFENTLYAIKEFFKAASLSGPVAIVLEDLQWLDADSAKVLAALTRRMAGFPLVVLASCRFRDDGSKPALPLDADVPRSEIELGHLPTSSVAKLAREKLGRPADAGLVTYIADRSGRNPFYVEQFCLYLKKNRHVELRGEELVLAGEEPRLPEGITALLVARLDRLSPNVKELVHTAAVLGKDFDTLVLAEMAAGKDVEALLTEGEAEQVWSAISDNLYSFRHALLRDAAYDMQLQARLKNLHRAAAEAIGGVYAGEASRFADVAFHYERAEVRPKAKTYLEKAARYAKGEYKNDEALALYDRYLNYVQTKEERVKANEEKAAVLRLVGRWEEAQETLKESLTLANELQDRNLVANSELDYGVLLRSKGSFAEAFPFFERARAIYADLGEQEGLSRALNNLGILYAMQGDYDKATASWRRQLDIAEALGDKQNLFNGMLCLGNLETRVDNPSEALRYYKAALDVAEASGDKRNVGVAAGSIGIAETQLGRYGEAMEHFGVDYEIAVELGDKQGTCRALGNIGVIHSSRGDYERALECYEEALAISEELGDKLNADIALTGIASLLRDMGRDGEAEAYYRKAAALAREIGDYYHLCEALRGQAELRFDLGRPDEAAALNDEAKAIAAKANRRDVSFNAAVLSARIAALENADEGLALLKELSEEHVGPREVAVLRYETYKLTGDETDKKPALAAYRELYNSHPEAAYKSKIEELED